MPWSAGTFSRANGATGWQDDQAANIGIEAGRHDTQDNDFRNGINETINKAGQNTPTANLPMGGYKHTGVANAAASGEYAAYGQVQAGVNVQSTALDWTATQYSNDTTAAKFVLQKSRGATTGSNVIVNSGDAIGTLEFRGNNGTTFTSAATMSAAVDGSPGATNDMPGRLVFATSSDASGTPTERMRIGSNGNIGIGTTSTANRLTVKGTGTGTSTCFRIIDSSDTENFKILDNGRIVAPDTYNSTTANAANVNVDSAGNYQRSTSSIRYKTDVQDAVHGLAEVLLLRSVTYKGINDGNVIFGGLIAEEVDAAGLSEFVQYDGDGQPDALAYSNMVALLIKAIQELEARVAALEGV